MVFDAVILAGGRGSRLGGASKARLLRGHVTLLELAIRATDGARQVVVVGDVDEDPGYTLTRETPAFSGPVAAVAAGVSLLSPAPGDFTLVLACDIPDSAAAVTALRLHVEGRATADGAIARDATGHQQYLLG
ncbi:MAG: NTP transferase domain-containing protein, partial [Rhodoglobus sp.]|nr:NTP transferase domain-containing protein [Rhodoglobus sp.]